MRTNALEKDIQHAICEYLAAKHYFFWRQNTAPSVTKIGGKIQFRRMPPFSLTGVPDILMIHRGTFWGLEVKRQGTKQSENQVEFDRRCRIAGGRYEVVRSLDDVIALGL